MALVPCKECGTAISTMASSCPKCGAPTALEASRQPHCARCQTFLVAREKSNAISLAGIIGALGFIVGLIALFASAMLGLIIIIASLMTGALLRPKRLALVCPKCGWEAST